MSFEDLHQKTAADHRVARATLDSLLAGTRSLAAGVDSSIPQPIRARTEGDRAFGSRFHLRLPGLAPVLQSALVFDGSNIRAIPETPTFGTTVPELEDLRA